MGANSIGSPQNKLYGRNWFTSGSSRLFQKRMTKKSMPLINKLKAEQN